MIRSNRIPICVLEALDSKMIFETDIDQGIERTFDILVRLRYFDTADLKQLEFAAAAQSRIHDECNGINGRILQ